MFTSNATESSDLNLVKQHMKAWRKSHKDDQVDVKFTKAQVAITVNDEIRKLSRKAYEAWAGEGFPAPDEAPAVERSKATRSERKSPGRNESHVEVEVPSTAFSGASGTISTIADEAYSTSIEERAGSKGKNAARFRRGEQMIRLHGIARANKMQMKDALDILNEKMLAKAGQQMVADFKIISEKEATTTRKVVEAFGSDSEFDLVNAINPSTGEPMVNDAGRPPRVPLTEVAMNKLYSVVPFAETSNLDELLSFTHRYPEKVVAAAKRVALNAGIPFKDVTDRLDEIRTIASHAITGEPIHIQADEKTAIEVLRNMAGKPPVDGIATIKTSRAWFDSSWRPVKRLIDAVMHHFHPEETDPIKGEVSNVFILETLFTQFFDGYTDGGINAVLAALIQRESITKEQAVEFTERFQQVDDEWVDSVTDAPSAPDGDEGFEDEDYDFDPEDEGFEA